MCVCVCVCVCEREREVERVCESEIGNMRGGEHEKNREEGRERG